MRGKTCSLADFQSEENKLFFLKCVQEQTAKQIDAVKQIQDLKQKLK